MADEAIACRDHHEALDGFIYILNTPPVESCDDVEKGRKFRYTVARDYTVQTGVEGFDVAYPPDEPTIILAPDGRLTLKEGMLYDGPSGIAIDTANFMRGSGIHDALYRLRKAGLLPKASRRLADIEMAKVIKEDGMGWFRRLYCFLGVRVFGAIWTTFF